MELNEDNDNIKMGFDYFLYEQAESIERNSNPDYPISAETRDKAKFLRKLASIWDDVEEAWDKYKKQK